MKRDFATGTVAALTLFLVYFGILVWAQGFEHAVTQSRQLWYWLTPLAVGFGAQAGLFSFIRRRSRERRLAHTVSVTSTGGVSAGSMVACCAHHLADAVPLLGLSSLALVLSHYQSLFLGLGVLSNLVGILVMLRTIRRHQLSARLARLRLPIGLARMKLLALVGLISAVTLYSTACATQAANTSSNPDSGVGQTVTLQDQTRSGGGVTFAVEPVYEKDKELLFNVQIDTHSGSLNFDLTKVSSLEDGNKKVYRPLRWEGSPPGGHHRSGKLVFPKLGGDISSLKLTITNVPGVPELAFFWKVN